jgi:hypothetical protein
MRLLVVDLETTPNLAYTWGLHKQDIAPSQLVKPTDMLCFAAKWVGEREVVFHSVHSGPRKLMVRAAHSLLDEADAVVHYNGTRFDVPHLNREFVLEGLSPPAPYKQIDLCSVIQRKFRFASSKLEHVASELGIGGKVHHEGFRLWVRCMNGDNAAWKKMESYNKKDVKLTEELYNVLLPWIGSHPHRGLYGENGCPKCASVKLQKRGEATTRLGRYQRWVCIECGSWFRSSKRIDGVATQDAI